MSGHVFICYARQDSQFVLALATKLKDRGVPVWLDLWNIPPGADWDESSQSPFVRAFATLPVCFMQRPGAAVEAGV
jgi:hypothetical protein